MGQTCLPDTFGAVQLFPDSLTNRRAANSVGDSHNEEDFCWPRGVHLEQENIQIGIQTPAQEVADPATLLRAHLVKKAAGWRAYLCHHKCDRACGLSFLGEGRCE